jgi:uncharacterized phage protein gp47/JayE
VSLSLAQLLTPSTEQQSLDTILDILTGLGFTARSWQSGSIARTLVQMVARLHSSASNTTVVLTKGRYNDTATGDWLTLLSASHFGNTRIPAVAARIKVRVDDSVNSVGPFTSAIGELVATDTKGVSYRNIDPLSLAQGATADLIFEAEIPGLVDVQSSVTLSTPLAGTTVTYQSPIRPGANEESDERLRRRNQSKWASLAYAAPSAAYELWALEASAAVTRVWVDDLNTQGTGRVDVYIAGASGALPGAVATTVDNYVRGQIDGVFRLPLGVDLHVLTASNETISVTGTIYSQLAADLATIRTRADKAVKDYVSTLPVGGKFLLAEVYRRLMSLEGVANVNITQLQRAGTTVPLGDVVTTTGKVPVGTSSFTSIH